MAMVNNINWTIVKASDGYNVWEATLLVATLRQVGKKIWCTRFPYNANLDFDWDNLDICIGYVRGVEKMTHLMRSNENTKVG